MSSWSVGWLKVSSSAAQMAPQHQASRLKDLIYHHAYYGCLFIEFREKFFSLLPIFLHSLKPFSKCLGEDKAEATEPLMVLSNMYWNVISGTVYLSKYLLR